MIVERKVLIDAVKLIDMVPTVAGLASSEFLRVSSYEKNKKLYLQAARGVMGCVSLPYQSDGQVEALNTTINRNLFSAFVGVEAGSEQNFAFSWFQKDNAKALRITQGRRKADFAVRDPLSVYGDRGSVPEAKLLPAADQLGNWVACCQPFASNQASEGILNCVMVDRGVMAINQISAIRLAKNKKFPRVPVPLEFGTLWTTLTDKKPKIAVTQKEIQASIAGAAWFRHTLHSQALLSYPDQKLTDFIKKHEKLAPVALIRRSSLIAVAARYGSYFAVATEKEKAVHFLLTPGASQARFRAQVQGSQFDEPIFLEEKAAVEAPQELLFDSLHFLPFVKALEKKSGMPIRFRAPEGKSYIFDDESVEFMLARRVS